MNLKIYENSTNYTGTVVEIKQLFTIDKSDNILRTVINHNNAVVSKDTGIGEWGLFFPVETQLSNEFLKNNNLYRDNTLNIDTTKRGYFELNGRIRCQVFRGVKSEGFYISITSLDFLGLDLTNINIGNEFNEIEGIEICKKYIPKNTRVQGNSNKIQAKKSQLDLIVENQFRLHRDTEQLKKHIDEVKPDDIISITYKLHGTSAVFSNILVKRVLSRFERLLKWFGISIQENKYGNVYSSRNVIKDVDGLQLSQGGFYSTDIWGIVNEEVKDKILQGVTIYGEIVGFLPEGKMIQEDYDYGLKPWSNSIEFGDKVLKVKSGKPFKSGNIFNTVKGVIIHPELNIPAYTFEEDDSYVECRKCAKLERGHELHVYRITYTNPEGHVFEFGWQDIKDYCKKYGLKHVPELYYGKADDYTDWIEDIKTNNFHESLLTTLSNEYLEKDCWMCRNKVPAEGIVLRIERGNKPAFKLKSFKFLSAESLVLDKGEIDIEAES